MPRSLRARKLAVRALVLVSTVVALIVAAAAFLDDYVSSDRRLARWLEAELTAELDGNFSVGDAHYEFPNKFGLQNLVVRTTDGESVLEVGSLSFRVGVTRGLRRRIRIVDLEIVAADVNLAEVQAGRGIGSLLISAFQHARPAETRDGPGWQTRVEMVRLSDIAIRIPSLDLEVTDLGAAGGVVSLAESGWSVEAASVVGRVHQPGNHVLPAVQIEIGSVMTAGGATRETSVTARLLRLATEHGTASGDLALATSGTLESSRLDFQMTGSLPVDAPWLREILQGRMTELPVTGVARARLSGTFDGGARQANAVLELEDGLAFSGVPLGPGLLDAQLREDELQVDQAMLEIGDGEVRLSGSLDLSGERLAHETEITLDQVPLRRLATSLASSAPIPDQVSGRARLADAGDGSTQCAAELTFSGASLIPGGSSDAQLSLVGRIQQDHLSASRLLLQTGALRLEARGRARLSDRWLAVELHATHTDPTQVLVALDTGLSADEISLDANIEGPVVGAHATGVARIRGLRVPGVAPLDLDAPLQLENQRLRVTGATLETPGGPLTINASMALPSPRKDLSVTFVGSDIAVSRVAPTVGLNTRLAVNGSVTVRHNRTRIALSANSNGGSFRGIPVRDLRARAESDLETIDLTDLSLGLADDGRIGVHGMVGLVSPELDLDLDLEATGVPVQAIESWSGVTTELSGIVSVSGRMAGPRSSPRVTGDARITGLSWRELALGSAHAHVDGNMVEAELSARVTGPTVDVEAEARVSPKQRVIDGRLVFHEVAVGPLTSSAGVPLVTTGHFTGALHASGALPFPDVEGRVQLQDWVVGGRELGALRANVATTRKSDRTAYSLRGSVSGGLTVPELSLVVEPDPLSVTADVTLEGFTSRGWVPVLDAAEMELVVSGTGHLFWSPAEWRASVSLTDLLAELPGEPMRMQEPARIDLDTHGLVLGDLRLVGEHSQFAIAGTLGDALDMTAKGEADAALLTPLIPRITRASGRLGLDIRATGTRDAPILLGSVQPVRPITARLRGIRDELSVTHGRVRFTPDRVELEDVDARFGSARVRAHGNVGLAGLRPQEYAVEIDVDGLVVRNNDLTLQTDGTLSLHGTGAVPSIRGQVQITRGHLRRAFALRDLTLVARPGPPSPATPPPDWLAAIGLDIAATTAEPFEVEVNAGTLGLRTFVESQLRVRGTAAAPMVEGRLRGESGTVRFPSAELNITELSVDFAPALAVERAAIHVRAEGEIVPRSRLRDPTLTSYFADVRLDGDLERLSLEVHTDPELDSLEALILLATGFVAPPPGARGTGRAEADAALAIASSQLAAPLTDVVSDQIEDLFNIRPDLSAAASQSELEVSARQRIGSRLRLEGSYRRAHDGSVSLTTGRAQVLLTDRLFLEGTTRAVTTTDPGGESAAEPSNQIELKVRLLGD